MKWTWAIRTLYKCWLQKRLETACLLAFGGAFTYCGITVFKFYGVFRINTFGWHIIENFILDGHFLCCYQATLLLPASSAMPFEIVDRTYLEDHIIFSQPTDDGIKVVTLNGVKGFIQQWVGFSLNDPVQCFYRSHPPNHFKNCSSHIFKGMFSKPSV